MPAAPRRLRAAGTRGGTARRRRPPVLAVARYDRQDAPAGDIPARVHQEDGCQATATLPGLKYQEQGGPALRDLADVHQGLRRSPRCDQPAAPHDVHHGRRQRGRTRQELLHPARAGSPAVRLAPLYDVLSTIALELTGSAGQPMRADTHLAQRVGGQADIRKVTAASLIDEAATWGIRRRTASAVVTETLGQVLAAIPATAGDARVLAVIRQQAERISLG